jgi:hypothetical protein
MAITAGNRVVARDRSDIAKVLGAALAQRATPVAFDYAGRPVGWTVTP